MQLEKFFENPSLYTPYSNDCGFSFREESEAAQASTTSDVKNIIVL